MTPVAHCEREGVCKAANVAAWGEGRAVRATAEGFLRGFRGAAGAVDMVVLDPPRAGVSPEVRKAAAAATPISNRPQTAS